MQEFYEAPHRRSLTFGKRPERKSRFLVPKSFPSRALHAALKAHAAHVDSHNMRNRILAATLAASLLSGVGVASALPGKAYSNCTALHRDYPHGIARSGASDHVRG